ncbi:putative Galanin [Sulfurimonas gotlandica GD1]|uniref:Putative Galanin n=1 Tax=Sulfurimonas gotlandica (strain DSM 19862 / JCM 16533 / GD1) TaxID=929558 RepID=B6BNS1_SULGG|nr:DUF3137 domain-containing protein [Sulfurimonas gotlandica]EDZ61275.1 putative Galanin [Sulfurimonas gotlandica GD1]EHP28875.1 putative Galanin [Sulfurimonas gotlandica GD1]
MKNASELTDFYYKTLYPTLQELEEDRKHLRHRIVVVGIIYSLVVVLIAFSLSSFIAQSPDFLFFIGFGYFALGAIIYKFLIKDYTTEFKQSVIKPLIHAIDDKLSYNSNHHVTEHIFTRSDLFSEPDRMNGNDYVRGNIDGTKIEFSDIHAEKRHKNSKGQESWSTIFKGLFIVAEFNKNFHGKTLVLPDTAQSTFGNLIGNWLQSNNFSRDELVKMDDNNFEKEFVVYSSDQIEARYILSHSLMKKLLDFKNKSEHPVYISFIGNHIHMAVYYDKDLFEPSVFRSLLEYKIAMEYVKTLHLAISIVDELKLNQKLWSKQ